MSPLSLSPSAPHIRSPNTKCTPGQHVARASSRNNQRSAADRHARGLALSHSAAYLASPGPLPRASLRSVMVLPPPGLLNAMWPDRVAAPPGHKERARLRSQAPPSRAITALNFRLYTTHTIKQPNRQGGICKAAKLHPLRSLQIGVKTRRPHLRFPYLGGIAYHHLPCVIACPTLEVDHILAAV